MVDKWLHVLLSPISVLMSSEAIVINFPILFLTHFPNFWSYSQTISHCPHINAYKSIYLFTYWSRQRIYKTLWIDALPTQMISIYHWLLKDTLVIEVTAAVSLMTRYIMCKKAYVNFPFSQFVMRNSARGCEKRSGNVSRENIKGIWATCSLNFFVHYLPAWTWSLNV